MDTIVIDLDNTICSTNDGNYEESSPDLDIINLLHEYKKNGFEIFIYTSRNMRTFDKSIGKINAFTLPTIIKWLRKHNVPYDEIHIGKPWCGENGFYVDDKAIRPDEFKKLSLEEIKNIFGS